MTYVCKMNQNVGPIELNLSEKLPSKNNLELVVPLDT